METFSTVQNFVYEQFIHSKCTSVRFLHKFSYTVYDVRKCKKIYTVDIYEYISTCAGIHTLYGQVCFPCEEHVHSVWEQNDFKANYYLLQHSSFTNLSIISAVRV